MSIITDALRKAEQERELKAKQGPGETETVSSETEQVKPMDMFLEQSQAVEAHIEKSIRSSAIEKATPSQFREAAMVSLIAGVVALCLVALVLLPVWPGFGNHFSTVQNPFWNTSLFQVPPMYQQNILAVKPQGFNGGGVHFPFSLSGISFQGENRYAIVNGVIVQKDDSIDGARVKEILKREVTLDTKAGELKLKLP